jgi:hypothetical protein
VREATFRLEDFVNFRRGRAAAERSSERRRREDEAPRLAAVAPELESLRLEISEKRGDIGIAEASHIRRVVVEHAPALFLIPCGESSCREGGHDVTRQVLRALEQKSTQFEGEDPCSGQTGTAPCTRTLVFTAHATYKA